MRALYFCSILQKVSRVIPHLTKVSELDESARLMYESDPSASNLQENGRGIGF